MILDTTFIIDLLRGEKRAVTFAKEIENSNIIKVSTITIFEIYQGIREDEQKKVEYLFNSIINLNFTTLHAKKAGNIQRKLKKQGKTIDSEDCMIAAVALLENEVLVTKNVKHFSRISELKIQEY